MSKNWNWKGNGPSNDQKFSSSDCVKIFFMLSTFPITIQISGKCSHFAQKFYLYKKTTNKESLKRFKVKFLI